MLDAMTEETRWILAGLRAEFDAHVERYERDRATDRDEARDYRATANSKMDGHTKTLAEIRDLQQQAVGATRAVRFLVGIGTGVVTGAIAVLGWIGLPKLAAMLSSIR